MDFSESDVASTLSQEREDGEPQSPLRVRESETRRYGDRKAQLKRRYGGMPLYAMGGWIWRLDIGRGITENSNCDFGGVVESESVVDGVRGLGGGESSVGLRYALVIGSKTRPRLP